MSRFKGLRTFLLDLAMVLCLAGVAGLVIWQKADTEILWLLGAAYTGIATKTYIGKKQAGIQAVDEIKARNGGG